MKPLAERDVPELDPAVHFLDGERVEGEGEALTTPFPVTGEDLLTFRSATEEQVSRAVAGARRAFDDGVWRRLPGAERAAVLDEIAERLLARKDELAEKILYDNGKTRPEAEVDVLAAVGSFRAAAAAARDDAPVEHGTRGGIERVVLREPVGVVAALTPFNAPLMFASLKAAPALAAGNSVVLKPSERAPIVPVVLCEAAAQAGVPSGVFQLVQGTAATASDLVCDPWVDMITLTGGTRAGTAVMRAAAPTIKNLLLELGGKSAHVVLADADLERAVAAAAAGIFKNAGQRCFSGSRLLVEEAVADRVEADLAEIASRLVVGDPFDGATQIGALIDEAAVRDAEAFVDRAAAAALTVAAGGRRLPELGGGSFYAPTVLVGGRRDDFAAREELFGPVLTVIRVKDADEAVAVANDSRYGLAGGVWTRDLDKARRMAREIRTGYFWINTYAVIQPDMPFGGFGQSGLGREAAGRVAYEAYTEEKAILVDTAGGASVPVFGR